MSTKSTIRSVEGEAHLFRHALKRDGVLGLDLTVEPDEWSYEAGKVAVYVSRWALLDLARALIKDEEEEIERCAGHDDGGEF